MTIRLITLSTVAALAAGCATTDPASMPDRQTTTVSTGGMTSGPAGGAGIGTGTVSVTTSSMNLALREPIDATPDQVWAALHAVYTELGIPVETIDNANRILGNTGFVRTRRVGDQRLSRFFECGTNAFGGSVADSERLQLHITSRVLTDGGRTRLQTDVRGTVLPGAASGTAANCRSLGTLEQMVDNRVRQRVLQ